MPFGQEVKDFVAAFSAGYDMVESRSEKEERRLRARVLAAQAGKLEAETSEFTAPGAAERRIRQEEADLGYSEAQTETLREELTPEAKTRKERIAAAEVRRAQAQAAALEADVSPEALRLKRIQAESAAALNQANAALAAAKTQPEALVAQRALDIATAKKAEADANLAAIAASPEVQERIRAQDEATRESTEATTAGTRADTTAKELANQELQAEQELIRNAFEGAGLEVPEAYLPKAAIPEGNTSEDVPEPESVPGPQSALPVEEPTRGVQRVGYMPEEAIDTGARVSDYVVENQPKVATVRRGALAAKTRGWLDYAGQQTGLVAEVYSGGQPSSGKNRTGSHRHDNGGAGDLKLRDPETNRLLNYNNKADRVRIADYIAHAVAAGATGVGAGPGYMSPESIHIGGGKPATWAKKGHPVPEWVTEAYNRGVARRGEEAAAPARTAYSPDTATGDAPAFAAIEEMDRGPDKRIRDYDSADIVLTSRKATKAGLMNLIQVGGLNEDSGVPDPDLQRARAGYLLGEGAAETEDVAAAQQIVVNYAPKKKYSDTEKNLMTLAVPWEVYMRIGKVEKAEGYAAAILQQYRRAGSQYLAIGQAAASKGKMPEAIEALVKAYTFVPDGREIDIEGNEQDGYTLVSIDLATGKIENKQILTPQEMYAGAMGLSAADFDKQILYAAGKDVKEREEVGPAFAEQNPEYAGMTVAEVSQARQLREANKPPTRTGGAAKPFDDPERIGVYGGGVIGADPASSTGIRAALEHYLTVDDVDPATRETMPNTNLLSQLDSAEQQDVTMRYEQLADRIININGFDGDQRLIADFLVNVTAAFPEDGNLGIEATDGGVIYKGIEIPIDETTATLIGTMRGEAERKRAEDLGSAIAQEEQAISESKMGRAGDAQRRKREEAWRRRTGRDRDLRYVPPPMPLQAIP